MQSLKLYRFMKLILPDFSLAASFFLETGGATLTWPFSSNGSNVVPKRVRVQLKKYSQPDCFKEVVNYCSEELALLLYSALGFMLLPVNSSRVNWQ